MPSVFVLVLKVLRADVAARRQRVLVPAYFLQRRHLAEPRHLSGHARTPELPVHGGHPRDLLVRQLLLLARAGDQRAQTPRVDEQNLARAPSKAARPVPVLRQEPQRAGDLRVGEKLAGQLHHAVHESRLHQRLSHLQPCRLAVAQLPRRHHEPRRTALLEVVQEVQHPHRVRVARRQRHLVASEIQARVFVGHPTCAPAALALAAIVEGRIGQDVVGLQARVAVVEVGVAQLDLSVQTVDEQVHPAQAIGKVLAFLPVERQIPAVPGEQVGLHEHAAGAATRIEDGSLRRLQHRHQQPHDARRREVLAAALALGRGELADEVLVHAPDEILAAVVLLEDVLGEQIDQARYALRVQVRAAVDAGQQTAQFVGVGILQQLQDVVQADLDIVGLRHLADVLLARRLRHDEGARAAVLVGVIERRIVAVVLTVRISDQRLQIGSPPLVAQRQEPQEDNGQHVTLVVRRFDRTTQAHCGLPEFPDEIHHVAVPLGDGLPLLPFPR